MRSLLLLWISAACLAAQEHPRGNDAKALLLQVRKKVMLTVDRLPKYMCTETIDRSAFRPEARVSGRSCDDLASRRKKTSWRVHKYESDRLRLDVAISGGGEMYSWAGEDRFQDRSLADLVQAGATSTGAFADFLNSIFGTNAANFTYNGEVTADGRALTEFGFRVALEKSSYRIETKVHGAVVAYDGTFLVDATTFDLVRLTVRADQLPAELNACEDITTLDYGSVRLNNSEFLLPKEVRLNVSKMDGSELENRTVFSGCHEFLGESSLSFGDATQIEQVAAQKAGLPALALPPGLTFRLALTHAIDTATAAAGDPFKAKLTTPIRQAHNGVLVPKGAAITGRIVQIKRSYGPVSQSLTLALKLETIEAGGVQRPFSAKPESLVERMVASPGALAVRQNLGSFDQMFDADDPSVGVLEIQGVTENYVIKPSVELDGITTVQK
jgi:hypothetical protein